MEFLDRVKKAREPADRNSREYALSAQSKSGRRPRPRGGKERGPRGGVVSPGKAHGDSARGSEPVHGAGRRQVREAAGKAAQRAIVAAGARMVWRAGMIALRAEGDLPAKRRAQRRRDALRRDVANRRGAESDLGEERQRGQPGEGGTARLRMPPPGLPADSVAPDHVVSRALPGALPPTRQSGACGVREQARERRSSPASA